MPELKVTIESASANPERVSPGGQTTISVRGRTEYRGQTWEQLRSLHTDLKIGGAVQSFEHKPPYFPRSWAFALRLTIPGAGQADIRIEALGRGIYENTRIWESFDVEATQSTFVTV